MSQLPEHLRGTKKYDPKTKKAVMRRCKQLRREGKRAIEIAEILNSEGFKTPNGKPCDNVFVTNQLSGAMARRKVGKKAKRRVVREPRATKVYAATGANGALKEVAEGDDGSLPPSIELMLSDARLTAKQKVELVLAYQRSLG